MNIERRLSKSNSMLGCEASQQVLQPVSGELILGEGYYVSDDDRITGVNANICVVGSPGSGKTRSVVIPNILNGEDKSFIVSDPKGQLYRKYGELLKKKGREVLVLDFTESGAHSVKYNPFVFIKSIHDVMKFAHVLAHQSDSVCNSDPFWDLSSEALISSLIAYLKFYCPEPIQNLHNLSSLLSMASLNPVSNKCQLDDIMDKIRKKNPDDFCVRQWDKVRVAPLRTYQSILVTATTKLTCLDTPEVIELTGRNTIDFESMVEHPTVMFVTVSDTDRSMDSFASLLMEQAYSELVYMADHFYPEGRLGRHITFILDDYASSLKIPDLDKILSASRSRNISSFVILQSESQLKEDAEVILGSCDNYIFLGNGDLNTCRNVALKCDLDVSSVINQKIRRSIVLRRGTQPVINQKNFDLDIHKELYYADEKRKEMPLYGDKERN